MRRSDLFSIALLVVLAIALLIGCGSGGSTSFDGFSQSETVSDSIYGGLEGFVLDSNGVGLHEAYVTFDFGVYTTTNGNGYYRFDHIIADAYPIIASKDGYISDEEDVEVLANQVISRSFTLKKL